MTTLAIIIAAVLAVTCAVAGWLVRQTREVSWIDGLTRRRILVQTTEDRTVDGRLLSVDSGGILLEPAKIDGTPIAGKAWVPREQVAWIQEPPADDE